MHVLLNRQGRFAVAFGQKPAAGRSPKARPELLEPSSDSLTIHQPDGLTLFQGELPSCQVLAALCALSRIPAGARLLKNMVTVTATGDYTVIFPGHPRYRIPVQRAELRHQFLREADRQPELPFLDSYPMIFSMTDEDRIENRVRSGEKPKHVSGDLLARILELAYARLQKQMNPRKFKTVSQENILAVYEHPNYHYDAARVLRALTGQPVEVALVQEKLLARLGTLPYRDRKRRIVLLAVTQNSNCSSNYLDMGQHVLKHHVWAVDAVDGARRVVRLREPSNTRIGLEIPYEEFLDMFSSVLIGTVP